MSSSVERGGRTAAPGGSPPLASELVATAIQLSFEGAVGLLTDPGVTLGD